MKMFKTNNINIVKACQEYFSFDLHSVGFVKTCKNFLSLACYINWLLALSLSCLTTVISIISVKG